MSSEFTEYMKARMEIERLAMEKEEQRDLELSKEGTKGQLEYRWRKWKKEKTLFTLYIVYNFEHFYKNNTYKHKNWEKIGIISYRDCMNYKNGKALIKKLLEKHSINNIIENGRKLLEFLEKEQKRLNPSHTNYIVFEKLNWLKIKYDRAYMDNLYLLSRINKENLEQCPHCLSAREIDGKIDFNRLGRAVERHRRGLEKSEKYISEYLIMNGLIMTSISYLHRELKRIEICNDKIELFREALDKRFPRKDNTKRS